MTGFEAFDDFLALARVTDLALSPDGTRLVATIATLNEDGNKLVSSVWEIDPDGAAPRRLTRSHKGESQPVFASDGSLLFCSEREGEDDEPPALWRLPRAGEAERVLTRPGGVAAVTAAGDAARVVFSSSTLARSVDFESEEKLRTARKDAKTSAVLHRSSPVRYWDHDLGPGELRLFAAPSEARDEVQPLDLTPAPGRALDEAAFVITPDGTQVITSWHTLPDPGLPRAKLLAIDTTTGAQRVLAEDGAASFGEPAVSRDGQWVVCVRERDTGYDDPPQYALWLIELATGAGRELVADPNIWPGEPAFGADGTTIFFLADQDGHRPVFRLDVATDTYTRVTASGHYAKLQVAPDGRTLFALRDAVDSPPRPVRLDATATDGAATELPAPGTWTSAGPLERIETTAADGTTVSAWLVLPENASAAAPAPLLLWIHGGPLGSWNGWSWRWNPWLMVGKGYAVLLPDPALSSGYGAHMVQRGWGEWGGAPYADLMAITDLAVARPDIDESRTAAMGGSYGGYMANWVAGHTDRFRCIVTHASLWALDQFQGTTDVPGYWVKEWGLLTEQPQRYAEWSPHHFLDAITTPMLVIHGDKDYRVPVSEALRLWWDLQRVGVESSYLYFPDEGHWILKPGNARVWYDTVWSWLGQHVHGAAWAQPELL